ncbi:MAG: DUF1565 domain-containing protein [Anaerolineae bacterium]|nr:DUF1565 domain-containing protein [Anaerolineae bacterium]
MVKLNEHKRVVLSLIVGGLLLVGLFLLLTGASQTARAASGNLFATPGGGGDCSQAVPCTLRVALSRATDGDTIYLAQGTYTGTGDAVVVITKSIALYGGWDGTTTTPIVRDPDAYPTTIDGEGARRGVYISGDITPTLQRLRITRGNAAGLGGYEYYGTYDAGGGVYVITATVTLADNEISGNTAQHGAGVSLINSRGALWHNTIVGNIATGGGGGVFAYEGAPTLSGNRIVSNTSSTNGGGLYFFNAEPSLLYNTITGNHTDMFGGGASVASCAPVFIGNIVIGNEAKQGGGIGLWYSDSLLTNNVVADNRATDSGSGLWIGGSGPSLRHMTIARDTGGDGSGIFVTNAGLTPSTVVLTNTILVSHTVGISAAAGSTVLLEATLWGNGTDWDGDGDIVTGTINVWGNPAFVNPDGGDYHIGPGSAARNAGVDAGVTIDIDREPRPKEGKYDIGADEFGQEWNIYLPLEMKHHP